MNDQGHFRPRVLSGIERPGHSMIAVFAGADHTMCPAVPDKDYQPGCRFVDGYEDMKGDWIERVAKPGQ